jgi:hypothetical protein
MATGFLAVLVSKDTAEEVGIGLHDSPSSMRI